MLIVAGGIGQTPFPAVIQSLSGMKTFGDRKNGLEACPPRKISFAYGARSEECLADLECFQNLGVELHLATNDGSRGHRGYVTDLVPVFFDGPDPPTSVFACGPEPMLAVLNSQLANRSTPCWVSMETRMACGYGVCFSCVCPIRESGSTWDYRRVCLDGAVFAADAIAWERL